MKSVCCCPHTHVNVSVSKSLSANWGFVKGAQASALVVFMMLSVARKLRQPLLGPSLLVLADPLPTMKTVDHRTSARTGWAPAGLTARALSSFWALQPSWLLGEGLHEQEVIVGHGT